MNQTLRHLLIALALLFGQQAALSHALYHDGLALAGAHQGEHDGENHAEHSPAADHDTDRCLAFQAIGSALTSKAPAFHAQQAALPAVLVSALPVSRPPRIEFDSRAPPHLFS